MVKKTTLREVIDSIKPEDIDYSWTNLEGLSSHLEVFGAYGEENGLMGEVWLERWVCTDTHVGLKAYFLKGEFVCLSSKPARKSPENFSFVSRKATEDVRNYLLSLVDDPDCYESIDMLDMDEELSLGYHIAYSSQIMPKQGHATAVHEFTNQIVEIVKTYDDLKHFHEVVVRFPDGSEEEIHCEELLFRVLDKPWKKEDLS